MEMGVRPSSILSASTRASPYLTVSRGESFNEFNGKTLFTISFLTRKTNICLKDIQTYRQTRVDNLSPFRLICTSCSVLVPIGLQCCSWCAFLFLSNQMERFAALDYSQVPRNGSYIVSPLHTGIYHYDCSLCMQDEPPPLLLLVLLLQSCCLVSSKDLSIDMRYDAPASRIHTVYFLV